MVDLGDHFSCLTFMVMFSIICHYQNTRLSVSFIFMRGPCTVNFVTYYTKICYRCIAIYLSYPLSKENAKLAVEFSSLKENLKEKEDQLQVLGVQKASLETSLFELTAEVEEDKKKIEDKWKKDVEKIRSLLEHSQVVSEHILHNINITSL